MSTNIEKLEAAMKHAMSIRPKVGGFPVLAEVLRQAGVYTNHWSLPSCQSIYVMQNGAVVQQGAQLITGAVEISKFDRQALIGVLRADQNGKTTFPEFLEGAWKAGVISYEVDFIARVVVYRGVGGEEYSEEYPPMDLATDSR